MPDTLITNVAIWPGSSSFHSGSSTPFGFYDSDTDFQKEADKVAKSCAENLGYPSVDVELVDINFYTCFEEAVTKYSAEINRQNTKDYLLSVIGATRSLDLTGREISLTMNHSLAISKEYGTEGYGGNVPVYSGSINCAANQTAFDLNALFRDVKQPGKVIEIKRVYYNEAPAIVRYFDPFIGTGLGQNQLLEAFGFGNYSPAITFTLMPIYEDLFRLQAIKFNDKIRKSQFSFYLQNNTIHISPIPQDPLVLWFDYILVDDRANPLKGSAGMNTDGRVSDSSNIPYKNLTYKNINSIGREWIYQYAKALAKEMLGWVRSKYGTIPIPDAQVSLNGAELIAQAAKDKEDLIKALRDDLEAMSLQKQMEMKKKIAEDLQQDLLKTPLFIFFR